MYNNSSLPAILEDNFNLAIKRNITNFSFILFIFLAFFAFIAIKSHIIRTAPSIELANNEIEILEEVLEKETQTIHIKKKDNLASILKSQLIDPKEIEEILKLDLIKNIALQLKPSQSIILNYDIHIVDDAYDDLTTETRNLNRMIIQLSKVNFIEVIKLNEKFVAQNNIIPLKKILHKSSTVINKNLVNSLRNLGLGANSVKSLVSAYSHQIDFQRQIKNGDTVTLVFEKFVTDDNVVSHYGKVLYACLSLSDKDYILYGYSSKDDKTYEFYSPEGKSVKRNLLRTPLNVSRISSHYGNRIDPMLGFTKMHRGVDFAAPHGTPIRAAGSGVITEIGFKGAYGRFIQIKHSPNLSTAYAHASGFAKNLKIGSVVKQGDIIAYVGSSGRATGPHLHYEVKVAGKTVNPTSIKTTPAVELTGSKLKNFKNYQTYVKQLLVSSN